MDVGIAREVGSRVSFFCSAFCPSCLINRKVLGGRRSPASGRVSDHVITTHADAVYAKSNICTYNLGPANASQGHKDSG